MGRKPTVTIMDIVKLKPKGHVGSDEPDGDAKVEAARAVLEAIKDEDAEALAEAFELLLESCDGHDDDDEE